MMSASGETRDRWGTAANGLLIAILLSAPLAVAVVHPAAWLGAWVLSAAALVAASQSTVRTGSPPVLPTALAALTGAALLLSVLPLPPSLVAALSPKAAELWALGPVGGAPSESWRSLHQTPGGGLFQLTKWGTAATFALACAARRRSFGNSRASVILVLSGVVSITAALVQTAVGAETVMGIYRPNWGFPTDFRATFINPNHFGAWLGIVLVLAIGLLLRREASARIRILGIVAAAAATLALVETQSRGGALGAAVGLVTLVALTAYHSGRSSRRTTAVGAVGVTIVLALAALQVDRLSPDFESPDTGLARELTDTEPRLGNLPQVLDVVDAHRWAGVGRGAFGDVFPRFQETAGRVVFAQVEVLPLQLLVDHGVIVGSAIFLLLLAVLAGCIRGALRHRGRVPAAAALVGLAAHELFDFSLDGGAVLLTAVLLVILSSPGGRTSWTKARWGTAGAAVALAALIALPQVGSWKAQGAFDAQVRDADPQGDAFQEAAEALWASHPSNWYLALELARAAAAREDLSLALRWTNRAMLLAPRQPDPHLLAARLLRSFGSPRQGLGEYRLALRADLLGTGRQVVEEVSAAYEDPDALARLRTPGEPEQDPWIALFGLVLGDPRARDVAHEAYATRPDIQLAILVHAWALGQEGRGAEAIELIRGLADRDDLTPYVRHLMARVVHKAGDTELAVAYLTPVLDGFPGRQGPMWLLLGGWLVELERPAEARRALRSARNDPTAAVVAESLRLEARLERAAGSHEEALELLARAERAAPLLLDAALDEVRLLHELGRTADSLARLQALSYIHGADPRFQALSRELEGPSSPDSGQGAD